MVNPNLGIRFGLDDKKVDLHGSHGFNSFSLHYPITSSLNYSVPLSFLCPYLEAEGASPGHFRRKAREVIGVKLLNTTAGTEEGWRLGLPKRKQIDP